MILQSTGLKIKQLGGNAFASTFQQGAIFIYPGTRPTTPDASPGYAPIAAVTNLGGPWTPTSLGYGLHFVLVAQYVQGDPSQSWILFPNATALGQLASWWRLVAPFDSGLPSITEPRLDGDVGVKGGIGQELLVDSLSLTPGTATPVSGFFYTIPPTP